MELANHTVINLITFVLVIYVGHHMVWTVTSAPHTLLMAVAGVISTIIIVGAMLATDFMQTDPGHMMGMVAMALTAMNVFGGFLVTQCVLEAFEEREPEARSGHSEGVKQQA